MGADDDADCAEHDWVLQQMQVDASGARMVHECVDCGALSYEPSGQD